jgi:hypothetical protein
MQSTLKQIPARMESLGNDALVTDTGQIWGQCEDIDREDDPENWSFSISPNWVFKINDQRDFEDSGEGYAVIGCDIMTDDGVIERCSFTLSILQNGVPVPTPDTAELNRQLCCGDVSGIDYHVVRRLHFDVDPTNSHSSKPVCHLQEGGKVSGTTDFDSLLEEGETVHYCRSNIKKPRVPHPPMDLVLVLDTVFSQYSNLIRYRDSNWKGLVRESESELWDPYLNHMSGRYASGDDDFDLANDVVMGRHDRRTW